MHRGEVTIVGSQGQESSGSMAERMEKEMGKQKRREDMWGKIHTTEVGLKSDVLTYPKF
jgi:hypothetical protein